MILLTKYCFSYHTVFLLWHELFWMVFISIYRKFSWAWHHRGVSGKSWCAKRVHWTTKISWIIKRESVVSFERSTKWAGGWADYLCLYRVLSEVLCSFFFSSLINYLNLLGSIFQEHKMEQVHNQLQVAILTTAFVVYLGIMTWKNANKLIYDLYLRNMFAFRCWITRCQYMQLMATTMVNATQWTSTSDAVVI